MAEDDGNGEGAPEGAQGARTRRRSPIDREAARLRAERDAKLVAAARGGDQRAFRELFDLYHRRALALAQGVVKDPEEARDVVQEAFVRVHKHLDAFEGSASFYTWLYRIVMNLSIDHARRSKKSRETDYDDQAHRDASSLDADLGTAARLEAQNPRRALLRRELVDKIEAALAELPEYHRAVIVLREVDGLSYEELAQVLEVPKGTIMSRLFHARRKMQESLEGYLDRDLDLED